MSQKTTISAGTDPVLIITAHQEFIDAAFGELKRFNTKLLYGQFNLLLAFCYVLYQVILIHVISYH